MSVYQSVLSLIEALDSEVAQGAHVRLHAHWAEKGEASSRYFFHLEKRRRAEYWIPAMNYADGTILSHIMGICDSWDAFFGALFSSCPVDLSTQNDLLDNLSSTVPRDQVSIFEG